MKNFFSVLIMLSSLNVFADYTPGVDFQEMQTEFSEGRPVVAAELLGAYSGRCFGYWETSSEATNLLNVTYSTELGKYRAASLVNDQMGPKHFDSYNMDQAIGSIRKSYDVNSVTGSWQEDEALKKSFRISKAGVPILKVDIVGEWAHTGKPWTFCKLVKKL